MNDKATERLRHICSHLDGGYDVPNIVSNVLNGTGSPARSAGSLQSYCFARGMRAWFEGSDIEAVKQWFYLSGESQVFYLKLAPNMMNLMPRVMDFSRILISDCDDLIARFLQIDGIYDAKRVSNVKCVDYHAFNIILAVKGEVELLAARCELFQKDPPTGNGKNILWIMSFFVRWLKEVKRR